MNYFRSLSVYAFTLFFNAAISFAGFSVLTHHLNEIDYGVINLYNSFTVFLTPFIAIGAPFVLSVDYFKMDAGAYRKRFTNTAALPILASIGLMVVFAGLYPLVQKLLKVNAFFAVTIPLGCLMVVFNEIILYLLRNKEKRVQFAAYAIGKNLVDVGLSLLLVILLGYHWEGRLGGNLISLAVSSLMVMYLVYHWHLYDRKFNQKEMHGSFLAGLPFIPERLAIFVLAYSDRFFIDHYRGTAEVGYYGAGAQVALIVNLAILSLNNTFYPSIYKKLSQETVDYRGVRKITLIFIGLSLLIALVVIAAIPLFFTHFIGRSFQKGQVFAVYLTSGFFFWAIYNVFVAYLLNLKKNKVIMLISLAGMLMSLIGNFINVRYFGAIGAAYTSLAVYGFMALLTIYFVHKYYSLKKIFILGRTETAVKNNVEV